jgi:glycosyltransferase involved in cell wall biosynthesis
VKITIIMGFFLPMPPVQGGAVEKSWHNLASEFARRGQEVTVISRRWPGWPDYEVIDGVRHVRLPGHNHRSRLWQNLLLDFLWSLRVNRALPAADVVVINGVSLPCWLGYVRPDAGRIVVMPGRMPKGQFRWYRRLARVLAPSSTVRDAVLRENPALASIIRIVGYPIAWSALSMLPARPEDGPVTLGYVGRIHREKGLELFVRALQLLSQRQLPAWRSILCGPSDVSSGGSGTAYLEELRRLGGNAPISFLPPEFDEARLRDIYAQIEVFCYPSQAAQGETFGVAVAEAMAAGIVPVTSDLPCFRDFVLPEKTGLTFNADSADAAEKLSALLVGLIADPAFRRKLGQAAQSYVQRYDYRRYAELLLEDFAQLTGQSAMPSSHP